MPVPLPYDGAMPTRTRRRPPWLRSTARAVHRHVVQSYALFFLRNLPRALRPRTLADHIRRKMLFDRRPYLAITADKVRARAYVRDKVGEHVLTRVYAIAEDPRAIDWSAVPRTYVCKATHGSGGVIIVSDDADPDARLPAGKDARWKRFYVRPEHATPDRVTDICLHWVRARYGWGPGTNHEHQYRHLTPRVLIEELLQGPDGGVAYDYKFFVFHGRCELISVISHRMSGKRSDHFRPDWTRVEVHGKSPAADIEPLAPANLAEMLRIAEVLGAETDFVRVDLYDLGDRVVFGELTNTPMAGKDLTDPAFDRLLGTFWVRGR
jgi:hypothetical protein